MTPELSSTFVYTGCAKDLWMEILERYSQSNAPMVFQLKLEIMRTMQGNLSVTAYYSKLKKCWDELQYMNGVPACTCGALGKCTCRVLDRMKELESQDKLMQFLANLNGEYDSVKSQILSSDPLPSVSKAYYTVLQVEKQKQIGSTVPESTAFMAGFGTKGNTNHRASYSEKRDNSKGMSVEKKLCSHCNKTGHLFVGCFEIIGYPDWYKGKHNKRSQGYSSRVASHVDRGQNFTPLDHDEEESIEKYDHLDPKFVKAMCSEMMKVFKSKMPTPNITNFSGISYVNLVAHTFDKHEWILDTGATDHMIPHLEIMSDIRKLNKPVLVKLPDGSMKKVIQCGNVYIAPGFMLQDVLHVSEFRFNLLSVSKIAAQKNLTAFFDDSQCALLDQSKTVIAVK
ncbi:unnamed protein product [Rhodiola kirilowii]